MKPKSDPFSISLYTIAALVVVYCAVFGLILVDDFYRIGIYDSLPGPVKEGLHLAYYPVFLVLDFFWPIGP